ncbi:PA domain-containing protein [Tahibacter aquaticus]|uniref:PA domain-containing protein n=1 Tax=Tahibacter aquaticus TaxID=520092 RepID=A0A4R6YY40_9GAMM|nr:PA domain-containing protein [Tahibacter aquaticus]TDR43921.1 PA domain-containing protein [Tahibacter aquaticus]
MNKQSKKFLGPPAKVTVNTPAGIAGVYDAQTAEFGASVAANPVTADVVLVNDGSGTATDGCETPFVNAAAIAGKMALIDRGTCDFTIKVKNAQDGGAVGVIIANNAAGLPGMSGVDPTITIPSLGTTQAAGTAMKANLPAPGVNAKLGVQTGAGLAGTQQGCVRMFAPNPVRTGSSVSHFHSEDFPNLLMGPSLNRSIFNKVDLTLPLFQDIDWRTNPEDTLFIDDFEPNPCAASASVP